MPPGSAHAEKLELELEPEQEQEQEQERMPWTTKKNHSGSLQSFAALES